MRAIPIVAITVAALSLSTMGAHADGTWCAQYGSPGATNCGFYSFQHARLHVRGTVDFASPIHSQALAPKREGDIDAEKRRTVGSKRIEPQSVATVESDVPRYARTYNPYQTVYMQ